MRSMSALALSVLIFLIVFIFVYSGISSTIETREGRMAGQSFPQEFEQFTIESVDGCWKSTEGNARLSMRACYCPCVRIKLDDVTGEGTLFGRFSNGENKSLGNIVSLHFNKDGFVASRDELVKVDGFTAYVTLDQGFTAKSYYHVHTIDESQALWRFSMSYKMNGQNTRPEIGFASISASDELPDHD